MWAGSGVIYVVEDDPIPPALAARVFPVSDIIEMDGWQFGRFECEQPYPAPDVGMPQWLPARLVKTSPRLLVGRSMLWDKITPAQKRSPVRWRME